MNCKGFEGRGGCLIEALSQHLPGGRNLRIADLAGEIQTEHLLNAYIERL
jgi:hypothetical protein